jgi:hypothetical protein
MKNRFRIMQNEEGNNDVERLAFAEGYNWECTGPGGCDSHCIESPCGRCAQETGHAPRAAWIWVAEFKSIDDAKQFYPDAELPPQCTECLAVCEKGSDICDECCDHSDMEDGYCLICGADRTEDLAAQAYDRAKAIRQDG